MAQATSVAASSSQTLTSRKKCDGGETLRGYGTIYVDAKIVLPILRKLLEQNIRVTIYINHSGVSL